MFAWLERLLTFAWLWRLLRIVAEWQLAQALERYGDSSMQARAATIRFSRIAFAERYGRPLKLPLQNHIKALKRAGLSLHTLRVLVLNKTFVLRDGKIEIRQDVDFRRDYVVGWATTILGYTFFSLVTRCQIKHCVTMPWEPMVLAIAAMSLGYYFLSLYTIRPYTALRRYRHRLWVKAQ